MNSLYKKVMPIVSFPFRKNHDYPMVFYHGVTEDGYGNTYNTIDVSRLKKQFNFLHSKGYNSISVNDMNDDFSTECDKPVFISFDDGLASVFNIAYPLAKQFNIKFCVFLEIGAIESKNPEYMNIDMLKEMYQSGLVSYGAHTYSHIDSRLICDVNAEQEIYTVNRFIENITSEKVSDFCLPFGYYNKEALDYLSAVYKRIYTTDLKPVCKVGSAYVRGRAGIENEDSLKVFSNKLTGLFNAQYYYLGRRHTKVPIVQYR